MFLCIALNKQDRQPRLEQYESGSLKISAAAFHDRTQKPSVDRAALCDNNPAYTKQNPNDGVVALVTKEVRNEKIQILDEKGRKVTQEYLLDIKPAPIRIDPVNLAHAVVMAHPDYASKSHFNKKVANKLAILAERRGWLIEPVE